MSPVLPSVACECARARVSLELDGSLSRLERAMLDTHVARCSECLSYRAEVTSFTHVLRRAPLESLEYPVVVRWRRRPALARLQMGVAAIVAIAALGLTSQLADPERQGPAVSRSWGVEITRYPTQRELEREVAILETMRIRQTAARLPVVTSRPAPI